MGVAQSAVNRIEAVRANVTVETLVRIAVALSVPLKVTLARRSGTRLSGSGSSQRTRVGILAPGTEARGPCAVLGACPPVLGELTLTQEAH